MVKSFMVKIFAALMAIWAAWSLGRLSAQLQNAEAQAAALRGALEETQASIGSLSDTDPEDILRSMGYVYQGDILFFDGG